MIFYYLSNFYRYRKYILIFESSYYRLLLFHIIERKKKREREYTITRRERKIFLLHWKKKKKKRKSFSSIKVFPLLPFSSSSSFFFPSPPSLKLSHVYTLAKIRCCCWLAGKNFPFPKHESHALFPPFRSVFREKFISTTSPPRPSIGRFKPET